MLSNILYYKYKNNNKNEKDTNWKSYYICWRNRNCLPFRNTPVLSVAPVARSFVLYVVFCRSLFVLILFCPSFDFGLLITPLVSWNMFLERIRVITKLSNTEQFSKGKGKTHKSTNRQNKSTTGKLGKPQLPWLGTGISKEMVGWIRFYGAKPPDSITVKRFRLSLEQHFLTILGQIRYNSSQRSTVWKSIVYYRLCRTV
jgi:hypothetical protein